MLFINWPTQLLNKSIHLDPIQTDKSSYIFKIYLFIYLAALLRTYLF